ncbi:MAG: response regulator [Bacteroidia bacterium]
METKKPHPPLNILLADDDPDDRFFFDLVVKDLAIPAQLTTVEDGVELMDYLVKHSDKLPDVLFLDLNMPRKNGSECLTEIKDNPRLKDLPVIIYSTSVHEDIADILYKKGAHYYIRKTDMVELKKILNYTLGLIAEYNFTKPKRDKFILSVSDSTEKIK